MLSTVYDYSSGHRFLIHPIKSNTIVKGINKRNAERIQETTEPMLCFTSSESISLMYCSYKWVDRHTPCLTPWSILNERLVSPCHFTVEVIPSCRSQYYELVEKVKLKSIKQSNLQFGFTEGLSPNMAALMLSEVCSELKGKEMIFIRDRPFNLSYNITFSWAYVTVMPL
jgi:hypothetical protein